MRQIINKHPMSQEKHLLIKLIALQLTNSIPSKNPVYYSFSTDHKMHFSMSVKQSTRILNDDILISFEDGKIPEHLHIYRWQSHMIMFCHQIDITELKVSRGSSKKKVETRAGEILSLTLILLQGNQIRFMDKFVGSISQHYLLIDNLRLSGNQANSNNASPSYFIIKTGSGNYTVPILNGKICLKIPQTLEFQQILNGKPVAASKKYQSNQLTKSQMSIDLSQSDKQLCFSLQWGVNFFEPKNQNLLLLQSFELMFYDFEIKFENSSTSDAYTNTKVKVIYGSKCFELLGDYSNTSKATKLKKIINFMIKSDDEEINLIIEKNSKMLSQIRFFTDQIKAYVVNTQKKKFYDHSGKLIGFVKFKSEKGKNLSTPSNNKLWKDAQKKKVSSMVMLSVEQVSANYDYDQPLSLLVKTETEEKLCSNIPNFSYFHKDSEVSTFPLLVSAKPDEGVYLMVKPNEQNQSKADPSDFVGIAILNFSDLRLGMNALEIPFFKNQTKTVSINCLVNKIMPYPFIKSGFQSDIIQTRSHKVLNIGVMLKKISFNPYFYTFRYDNKTEVYCIVQANRLKKVLILQKSPHNQLSFIPASSSDSLNFLIEDTEYVKIKIVFLISDTGNEEQIYGFTVIKLKIVDFLNDGKVHHFEKVELKNDYGMDVGEVSLELHHGSLGNSHTASKQLRNILQSQKGSVRNSYPSQDQKNRANSGPRIRTKTSINQQNIKINQSISVMESAHEKSIEKTTNPHINDKNYAQKNHEVNPIRKSLYKQGIHNIDIKKDVKYDNSLIYGAAYKKPRYSSMNDSIKLPTIRQSKQSKKGSLKNLVQMMKIRTRSTSGHYEEGSTVKSYKIPEIIMEGSPRKHPHPQLSKIQRQNPNLQRNLEILFPKMGDKRHQQDEIKREIDEYEQKLIGLKSVLKEISQDIGEIEPTVRQSRQSRQNIQRDHQELPEKNDKSKQFQLQKKTENVEGSPQGVQWDDNEFANI